MNVPRLRTLALAAISVSIAGVASAQATGSTWQPTAFAGRYGYGDHTHDLGLNGRWDVRPAVDGIPGRPAFFVDAGVDVWHGPDAPSGNKWLGDFSAMAGLRWTFPSMDSFFLEGSFGPNILTQTRINNREFGIAFQFGTRVAAGFAFGEGGRYELAAFVQHVSNASLAEPNDGMSMVGAELRYRLR